MNLLTFVLLLSLLSVSTARLLQLVEEDPQAAVLNLLGLSDVDCDAVLAGHDQQSTGQPQNGQQLRFQSQQVDAAQQKREQTLQLQLSKAVQEAEKLRQKLIATRQQRQKQEEVIRLQQQLLHQNAQAPHDTQEDSTETTTHEEDPIVTVHKAMAHLFSEFKHLDAASSSDEHQNDFSASKARFQQAIEVPHELSPLAQLHLLMAHTYHEMGQDAMLEISAQRTTAKGDDDTGTTPLSIAPADPSTDGGSAEPSPDASDSATSDSRAEFSSPSTTTGQSTEVRSPKLMRAVCVLVKEQVRHHPPALVPTSSSSVHHARFRSNVPDQTAPNTVPTQAGQTQASPQQPVQEATQPPAQTTGQTTGQTTAQTAAPAPAQAPAPTENVNPAASDASASSSSSTAPPARAPMGAQTKIDVFGLPRDFLAPPPTKEALAPPRFSDNNAAAATAPKAKKSKVQVHTKINVFGLPSNFLTPPKLAKRVNG